MTRILHAIGIFACFFQAAISVTAQSKDLDSLHLVALSSSGEDQVLLYARLAELARNVNIDTAFYFANKANEIGEVSGSDKARMNGHIVLGRVLAAKANYQLAIKYYSQALALAQQITNDSLTAACHNGIGSSQWQLGQHAASLNSHFIALQIRERIGDVRGIVASKVNIGMVYQTQDKLPLAEKYVGEALELLRKKIDDASSLLSALHTQANIYGMQGKINEALALDKEGIAVAERTNNEFAKSTFYDNMGNCYFFNDPPDYDKAYDYFHKTLLIDSTFANKKQMSDSYLNIGNVFFAQKKYNEGIAAYQRSVLLAEQSGYTQGKLTSLGALSRLYNASGRHKEAYDALQQSMKVKDSMFNTASEAKIAEVQTVYETEKKQQQINLQQEQLSKKNFMLAATIIVAVLLGLLGYSFYRRNRLRQQAKMQSEIMKEQELATKAVIKAEEDERQRIARDLHDGVGQMMSAAKMNLSAFESEMVFPAAEQRLSFDRIIGLVDESCKEIRAVSHNMMPNALLKNSLAAAIRDFIDKMDKKALQVHLYTEGLEERLDSNIETVLYRVIQECVNNVIKHAGATRLDISITRDKDGISATIEDNGKGFDTTSNENRDSIGLKNIITRTEYLKGTVDFDSASGRGTVVALHVPLAV
jgi:signal transduction histidine kinase